MDIFLRGLLIGFSIAAPVGPIGVLCIRRTLAEGRLAGFLSGMGAASADMFYGAVAAFGLTASSRYTARSIQLAASGRWDIFAISGCKNLSKQTSRTSRKIIAWRLIRRLPFHLFPDHHQSYHHPIIHRYLCRVTPGRDKRKLHYCQHDGIRRFPGLRYLVVHAYLSWLACLRDRFNASWKIWINRIAGVIISSFGIIVLATT